MAISSVKLWLISNILMETETLPGTLDINLIFTRLNV
jgi:hypothetical protein